MGTKSAGCGCENVVFVPFCWSRSESGAPCFRGVHSSNKHYVAVYCLYFVYCYFILFCLLFIFFKRDCSFRRTT